MAKTPDEALILASIVEKETGKPADRPLVSSVFNNRLRVGMPLQTDPTVIYGMGEAFDGNLRKKQPKTDTPWNTYTRPGLPPTPIAMPGKASLLAAVQPAPTQALYFVARGDGTSQFSSNLDDHNRATGLFISFEGIDGAGKSTHINALAEAFRMAGRTVTLTREPGGTPLAEKLRAMVLNDAMDPLTESLLIFAGRRDHISNIISPAL
eukprot:gene12235-14959_t